MDKYLGLDYGHVRIGIALSDETKTFAFGKEFINNDKNLMNRINSLINAENISRIILGYPTNLKGERTKQTLEVESFEEKLRSVINSFNIEIIRWDERFTSKMAASSLIESGMKKKKRQQKGNIDIVSAALLLQSYLDSVKK
jgi:putative pre-16S rRNA nuclease